MTAPGAPESLSRTRSAAEASSSAIAISVAESSPPWRSRCRASPRAARCPRSRSRRRPARSARPGRSCRRSPPPGADPEALAISRANPPGGGIAVDGQQRDLAVGRGWRSRSPRSRRPSRPCVSVIRTPRSARTTRCALARAPAPPSPGPCRARLASSRARSPGSTSASSANPPLDLRDGLLGDDDDLVRRGSGGFRDQAAQLVALAQLGQARQGPDPQLASGQAAQDSRRG